MMINHEKTGRSSTGGLMCPRVSSIRMPRQVLGMLVLGIVLLTSESGRCALQPLEEDSAPAILSTDQAQSSLSPVGSDLSPEQQTTALKEEELELVKKLLKKLPDTEGPLILMGNVLARHGNSSEAIELWEKALALNPKRADAYCSLGKVALGKGEYDRAIEHYRKALATDPAVPDGSNGIARALMASGRQDEAVAELEKDVTAYPKHIFSHFLLGQLYLQKEDYHKAKEHYEAVTELKPDYTNAYYGLFSVYSRLKQSEKARENMIVFKRLKTEEMKVLKDRNEAYDDFVEMRVAVAETYIAIEEMLYRAHGDLQEAQQLLERAANIDPYNTLCLGRMGSLYLMSNRMSDALQVFRRISEIDPNDPICHLNIGIISIRFGRGDDAEKALQKVISLAPQSSDGYRELAHLYLLAKRHISKARQLAEMSVSLEEKGENYFILAWACDLNGDMVGALAAIEKAMELEPNNARYRGVYEHTKKKN